uniref:Uncharacterized protein n=1 Tax=Arundo donax TaxID=35708 RepID=A0A0A9B917_ARUDO
MAMFYTMNNQRNERKKHVVRV